MYLSPINTETELHALDPDLPFLAAEVAVDVDNLLAGKSKDQAAMMRLAEKLVQSIEIYNNGGPPRSRMDMATLTVLGEAVLRTIETSSQEIDDLLSKANEIAKLLGSPNPQNDQEGLKRARDFCLALSRAAAAYSESIRDLRPSHPFRK